MPDSLEIFFRASLRVVLCDFDGVVADTERAHYEAFTEMLRSIGIETEKEEYYSKYAGNELEKNISLALESHKKELSSSVINELMTSKAEHFKKLVPGLKIFQGVSEFFQSLSARKIPIVIVSSSLREEVITLLEHQDFYKYAVGIVAADDLKAGERKPAPIPYQKGLQLVNNTITPTIFFSPAECLVVEDTAGGIKSGKAASMKVLALPNSLPAETLKEAGADWVVTSLLELNKIITESVD